MEISKAQSLKNGDRVSLSVRFETGDHKHDYSQGSMGTVQTNDGKCAWVRMDSDTHTIVVSLFSIKQVDFAPVLCA
jgi:ribosomal protein L21E